MGRGYDPTVTTGDVGGADIDRSEIGEEGGSDWAVGVVGRVDAAVRDSVWADSSSRPSDVRDSAFCMEG